MKLNDHNIIEVLDAIGRDLKTVDLISELSKKLAVALNQERVLVNWKHTSEPLYITNIMEGEVNGDSIPLNTELKISFSNTLLEEKTTEIKSIREEIQQLVKTLGINKTK